jgi:hypothetical protein
MSLVTQRYVLSSFAVPPPGSAPLALRPTPLLGVHLIYTQFSRNGGTPPDGVQPDFLPEDTLSYQDGARSGQFPGAALVRGELGPDLGRTISVNLQPTVDTGAVFFTLVLPQVDPDADQQSVTALGITTWTEGPDTVPKPTQSDHYGSVALWGTYSRALSE